MSIASSDPAAPGKPQASATPGIAAPGKAPARGAASKRHRKDQHLCPICGVNPIGEDEVRCADCAEKDMAVSEGLHVGRNWLLLIVMFCLLLAAGKWMGSLL